MEQSTQASENNNQTKNGVLFKKPKKKSNKKIVLLVGTLMIIFGAVASYFLFFSNKEDDNTPVLENEKTGEVEIDKELDSDQDGLPDYIEEILGTDENNSDTDGDGYSDFEEIKNGYNPIDDEKYTEEEWEAVKEEIRNEKLYEEIFGVEQKQNAFSCGTTTIKDIDGNIYNTVKIGDQCWLKQNLKVTKNPAGDVITRYCYDNNTDICNTDGGLYDWDTAMDGSIEEGAQGICPDGWHVPKDSEWYVLESGFAVDSCLNLNDRLRKDCSPAGTELKAGGSSKFEGILAGNCNYIHYPTEERFEKRDINAYFWSSSTENTTNAWSRYLDISYSAVERLALIKARGFSVRCLKNQY